MDAQAIGGLWRLPLDDPGWTGFARRHADAGSFHQPAWCRLLAECYGYHAFAVVAVDREGALVAGLPVVAVGSRLTGRRWIALPFTDHTAPLARSPKAVAWLVTGLVRAHALGRTPPIEVRWPLPALPGVKTSSGAVLHTLDLEPDPQRVFSRFGAMHRRNVRKAEREGRVRVERDRTLEGVRRFYRLHAATRRRQGTPVQPWRFFRLLWARLIAPGHGCLLLGYHGAEAVAGAVFLTGGTTITYKYGASDLAHTALRPNNLLFWHAIKWACEAGYRRLDFGKSDRANVGLREFKRGWGAVETPLIYSGIGVGPGSRLRPAAAGALSAVIRRTPTFVARATGELLYQHFP